MAVQSRDATQHTNPTPIVAIGASAGGLEQIKLLLSRIPEGTGAAFVVLQHLDPAHESQLTELLDNAATLSAVTIEDGMPMQENRVHVLPPGHRLDIDDVGTLHLTASQTREAVPTLIDHFFRALAAACGRRAVGIILTGNGSDGALGLKAIRSAGGLAIAQHPDSAEFDGMPRAAARHASPDYLLDTADMIVPLCNHLRLNLNNGKHAPANNGNDDSGSDDDGSIDDDTLATALRLLREYGSYDFRHHKPTMLKRRLHRRMALNGVTSSATYLRSLGNDDAERNRLCKDFLISVTDFFREPDSYAVLNQQVIRKLLHNRSVDDPLRVWVPGCATGEEPYSIAMLIAEAIEATGRDYKYIVFATDIDERALDHARAGLYPESIEADLSDERLCTFFDKVDAHYQVKRNLRERVVFAPQSVTDDPPYSRLDLISCRNLLIYLTADTQKRLITLFHFALKDSGHLFLGSSETVGSQIDLFEPLSKDHRLYRQLVTSRQYRVDFPTPHSLRGDTATGYSVGQQRAATRPRDAEQIARDILLAEHVPAAVLVNRKLEILCSYGPTREFLSLPPGQSSLALLDMVRSEYRSHLRAVIHRAFRHDEQSDTSTTVQGDKQQALLITARPLQQPEHARGLVLITFERVREAAASRLEHLTSSDLEQQLAEELDATRNELHGTIAALEESNEDLKGSNEEIMSMNEELQSTNEELETLKEELQSVNEELTTVNTELETKVAELENAHDDLSNLFSGTQVATLFLDRGMRIKRFTPAIRELLNLISGDIGRPLADMTLKFSDPDLLTDADRVLDELTPREAEVQAEGERWYQRRILPYRTRDDVIKGVVITFADITDVREAMLRARDHEARLDLAVSALSGGMWEMAIDPAAPDALPDTMYLSPRLKQLLGFDDEQLPNSLQAWSERIVAQDRAMFDDATRRRRSDTARPVHYRIRHRDGSLRWLASYGRIISDVHGRSQRWVGIDCDITEYKQADMRARHIQAQLQLLADALPELMTFSDRENNIRFSNAAFNEWFGASGEELDGRSITDVFGTAAATLTPYMDKARQGKATSCNVTLANSDRGERKFQVSHVPHIVDGKTLGSYLLMTDMTNQAMPVVDQKEEQSRLAYIYRMAMIGEMASTLAHDINQPLSAINSYAGALTRMLHAGKPVDDTAPIVHKIADQVERTSGIVNDVRSLVGRSNDGEDAIDLNELVDTAISLTAGAARKHDVQASVSQHTPLPTVSGDAVQLQQVLVNLINNAIEAMRDSDRERTLWLTTQVADATHVQVVVTDSGSGLPPGKLESIFNSFESTKLGGMGMGLAISRSIAQWHGGRLWAESEPDHGATFYLNLPVDDSDA